MSGANPGASVTVPAIAVVDEVRDEIENVRTFYFSSEDPAVGRDFRVMKRTIRALEANDESIDSFNIKLGLGFFEIRGTNDRKKKIKESDEANDKTCITIEGI